MSKVRVGFELIPSAAIQIGNYRYYTVAQICQAIPCPEYILMEKVRDPEEPLHGQKIGLAYLIDEKEFNEWVKSGKFTYTKRTRAKSLKE